MRLLKHVFNEAGLGLAEIIVAVAIGAVVSVGVLGFVQNSLKSQRTLRASQAFNEYVSASQMALDDIRACTYNFGYVNAVTEGIQIPDVGAEMPIEILQFDANNPTQLRAAAKRIEKDDFGRDTDQTITKTVRLKTVAMTSPGHYIGRVIIDAKKTGEFIGSAEMSQGFPIFIITDDTKKIVSCYGNFASGGLSDLQQKQCEVLLGSNYFWNPKSNSCESRYETVCNPGTATQASCKTPSLGLEGMGCQASGFNDPSAIAPITRTYTSGATHSSLPPGAYACVPLDKFSVQCDYAEGVDYASATCSACCIVEKKDVQQGSPGAM